MRILVTGGQGTIAREPVAELIGRGWDVISLDVAHGPEEIGFSLRTDVRRPTYVRCDVGEYRQLGRVFDEMGPFDLVYHTAAEFGRWNGEDFYEQLWRGNAVETKGAKDPGHRTTVTLEEGMRRTVTWMHDVYGIRE